MILDPNIALLSYAGICAFTYNSEHPLVKLLPFLFEQVDFSIKGICDFQLMNLEWVIDIIGKESGY